jgi:hypothetical protein
MLNKIYPMKLNSYQIAEIINGVTSRIPRPDGSFPALWCDLPEDSKDRAKTAVDEIMDNPGRTAEQLHDLWMKPLVEQGWTCGEHDYDLKKHPCIVPFDDLPPSEILKDEVWYHLTELFRKYHTKEDDASDLC